MTVISPCGDSVQKADTVQSGPNDCSTGRDASQLSSCSFTLKPCRAAAYARKMKLEGLAKQYRAQHNELFSHHPAYMRSSYYTVTRNKTEDNETILLSYQILNFLSNKVFLMTKTTC